MSVPASVVFSVGFTGDLLNRYCCSLICVSRARSSGSIMRLCSMRVCNRVRRSCFVLAVKTKPSICGANCRTAHATHAGYAHRGSPDCSTTFSCGWTHRRRRLRLCWYLPFQRGQKRGQITAGCRFASYIVQCFSDLNQSFYLTGERAHPTQFSVRINSFRTYLMNSVFNALFQVKRSRQQQFI